MKYLEFANGNMVAFEVKSKALYDLIGDDTYLFERHENDVVFFGWGAKGDAFAGEEERSINDTFCLPPPYEKYMKNFDFCGSLISYLEAHREVGLITCFSWCNNLSTYDPDMNENFEDVFDNDFLSPEKIEEIINKLKENYSSINESIESFCIFTYYVSGDYDSELEVFTKKNQIYTKVNYCEEEIDDLMETDYFFEDIIDDSDSFLCLIDKILETHYT